MSHRRANPETVRHAFVVVSMHHLHRGALQRNVALHRLFELRVVIHEAIVMSLSILIYTPSTQKLKIAHL